MWFRSDKKIVVLFQIASCSFIGSTVAERGPEAPGAKRGAKENEGTTRGLCSCSSQASGGHGSQSPGPGGAISPWLAQSGRQAPRPDIGDPMLGLSSVWKQVTPLSPASGGADQHSLALSAGLSSAPSFPFPVPLSESSLLQKLSFSNP